MNSSLGYCSSSSRSSRARRGVALAAAGGGGPGGMMGDVEELNRGKSFQEQLSGETNTQVTDVMDIDRTPELLAWVFGSLFGRKEKEQGAGAGGAAAAAAAAPQGAPGSAMREAQDQGPAAAAVATDAATISTAAAPNPAEAPGQRTEVAIIGGGCFWCIEACFQDLRGVVSVTSGYAGGHVENPTYQQVLTKKTGHAEVVQVEYDPAVLSYKDVLQIFMSVHDPTTPNRQGNDVGPQYRSIVLYGNEEQKKVAEEVIAEANKGLWFGRKVVTELVQLQAFYRAESYHQRYYAKNPGAGYCMVVVRPKLQEFRRKYAKLLKTSSA